MPKNPLESIREVAGTRQRSLQWYQGQIKQLGLSHISAAGAMSAGIGKFVPRPEMGKMYLYAYDPKTKETLPFYDTFPLVFPFAPARGGFRGINLHYIPPMLRNQFIQELMGYAGSKTLSETSRLRLTWGVLSQYAESFACVKHYLTGHIRSRFLQIHPADWNTATLLPIEGFVGASKDVVYKDSLGVIGAE
jgi:hypothetical protein